MAYPNVYLGEYLRPYTFPDDVATAFNELPSLLKKLNIERHELDNFDFDGRISFNLFDWTLSNEQNISWNISVLADLNTLKYKLRVVKGYYCEQNECYVETDQSIDIKNDIDNINLAVIDILNGHIPLYNDGITNFDKLDHVRFSYIQSSLLF